MVPTQLVGAQSPSTAVLVPANGVTVSGTQIALDASASAGVTKVQFELTGGSLSDSVIATATPTGYGWFAEWNSTTVADGTYTLQSVATGHGTSATSPGVSITLFNGVPSLSLVLPLARCNPDRVTVARCHRLAGGSPRSSSLRTPEHRVCVQEP